MIHDSGVGALTQEIARSIPKLDLEITLGDTGYVVVKQGQKDEGTQGNEGLIY